MSHPASGRPATLLLVEDNPGDARLVKEVFKDANLANTLHVVTDGDEALDFVYRRCEYAEAPQPDVVLLDWKLPQGSGEDVLTAIKNDSDLPNIPVIVLSGSEAQEDVVQSYAAQANAFITKPVDPDTFVETLHSFEKFWLSVVRLPPTDEEE